MKKLTESEKQAYLDKPSCCPYCGSDELTTGSAEVDGCFLHSPISCDNCGREWIDSYALTDIIETETKEE